MGKGIAAIENNERKHQYTNLAVIYSDIRHFQDRLPQSNQIFE